MALGDSATRLREGQSFSCPHCSSSSVVKRVRQMEGWRCVEEYLACALCGARVVASSADASADGCSAAAGSDDRLARLRGLLAVQEEPNPVQWAAAEDDRAFCRDCRHFLKHPFVSRCLLHDRPVEPMDDCEDFDRAAAPETKAEGAEDQAEGG